MDHKSQALHQQSLYDDDVDYRHGSPHLSHWWLYDRLISLTRGRLASLSASGLPMRALEVGAGHGGFTEPVLAAGWEVTAVEASEPSLRVLREKYGSNPAFNAILDQDGSVDVGDGFALVLIVAVLHHIPDYITYLEATMKRLLPGGALLTLQDPLWYSRTRRIDHGLDRAGYLGWRLAQGDAKKGAATLSRRLRGVFDEDNPSDMVEYHVVRDGVDEVAVLDCLKDRFKTVEVCKYWSHQSALVQRVGEWIGSMNTFGVSAIGYLPEI